MTQNQEAAAIGDSDATYGWKSGEVTPAHGYLADVVLDILASIGPRDVLDLGCGNGAFTHVLGKQGYAVVGCDADRDGIEHARAGGGKFEVISIYDDQNYFAARSFDAVVSLEVVEHLYDPKRLLQFAAPLLKPDGHLVISTPYHGYLKNLALALAGKWDNHLGPLWDGGHIKFFSRDTLSQLLQDNGFEVLDFRGAGRLPLLWKSMVMVARVKPRD